ncbi:uncharacterized protein LOC109802535 isoform X3 [Cajanus cajan]|uniref:uncharacterized protein LOC109802535 isoform X3 n=1 Tax=Cajanus cajan TaxID=3821 RepID=UPI0010FBB4A5|nr:uncharacterized protein LOC109802535 isoform X3 [Cajanus cajan]
MEVLYSKLYDKYTKLKTKKLSDLDHVNKEQELKFVNFLSVAEELIEDLRTEKEELLGQVNALITELASLRSAEDKQVADYQRLLMVESEKNETLSEEVEKLLKLLQEGTSHSLNNNSNSVERESTQNAFKETVSSECGTKTNDQSGIDLQESGHGNWLIQALFVYALGMKLSTDYQSGRVCLSALHQSSGYSFSLSWISKSPGEEAELLYHVLSLGAFERVAPEWMREDIMFSPSMLPNFFERVSHVVKLNH